MKVLQFVKKEEKRAAVTGITAICNGAADNYDFTNNLG